MVDMPARVAALPQQGSLPVPFTVEWFDGIPDFRVINPEAVIACALENKCGVCGQDRGDETVFVGGERSIETLIFRDAPMHRECAEYSAAACPVLSGTTSHETYREGGHRGPVATDPIASANVPAHVAIVVAGKVDLARDDMGLLFFVREVREQWWTR